ncbi:hypothetical protein FB451DRAFT_1522404 [Mycena latifolia]|nr:hypothetical protein FB451DRAFT_1522404 [Mycena latifolia]
MGPVVLCVYYGPSTADNTVYITDTNKYWTAHTAVGDSERPGGMQAYCSPDGRYSPTQGLLPTDFWTRIVLKNGMGVSGQRPPSKLKLSCCLTVTGYIRVASLDRLNATDDGGQYDSSGGDCGLGNPQGSVCLGYKHYVELLGPSAARACIRCCDDAADCPTNRDTAGCPEVISGDYVGCE